MFDLSPDVSGIFEPVWIADDRVVLEALAPGETATVAALELEWMEEHAALWQVRNEGRSPTASSTSTRKRRRFSGEPPQRSSRRFTRGFRNCAGR